MSNPESEQSVAIAEAWRLQREGIELVNAGRPADGAAMLRRGLGVVGWVESRSFIGTDSARYVAARLLGCLALAESELGHGRYGIELLDVADTLVSLEDRGILANQRGLILRLGGHYIEALRSFEAAEPLLAHHDLVAQSVRVLLNRASTKNDLGRYREAKEDLQRCEGLARQHGWIEQLAKASHARGIAEYGLGDVPTALKLFAQAEEHYSEVAPDMIPQLAMSRSQALRAAGLKREASSHLDAAIRELKSRGRDMELLRSEVTRARLAVEMGDLDLAVELASRARERAQQHKSDRLSDWAEQMLREAEFRHGFVDNAFSSASLDLARRQRVARQDDVAELAELLAARAFVRANDFEHAREILIGRPRTAGAQVLTSNATRFLARAELARATGNRLDALADLRNGLAGLHRHRERFGSLELQTGVSSLGAELAEMGLELALESSRPSTVFDWSERSRAQAFRLPSVRPPDDPEIANMLARVRELRAYIRRAKQENVSVDAEKAECADLESELRQRDWQTSGPGSSAPEVKPRQIHDTLATDQALVSFIHHNGHLHALTMVNGRNKLHSLGELDDVEESLQRLVADLNASTGRRLPEPMAAAVRSSIQRQSQALDDRLFSDLRRRLGDRELIIVPTKSLYAMPWSLLPSLRGRPVTVSPSAAVWLVAHNHVPEAAGKPLLASGPDLSLAEAELDTISEHYYNPIVLRDSDATPESILTKLDGAPVAHLAAHGLHEPDNFLFSRLDFADGPLMAHDIARLKTPPSHVTLSACDVGQSKVSVGDETLGFTAALLYAGTRTVVSSVAKVEHDVAANIMTAYHANVVAGMAPAHALARAADGYDLNPFVCYGAS